MTATEGAPKSVEDLHNLLQNDTKVKVAGIDVDGVLRGKFMSKDKFLSAVKGDGFGFCSVIFGWDMHDLVYSNELLVSNRANGYRDILARIDLGTYRRISWEANVPFFLLSFLDPETHEPIPVCPRGTLAKAIRLAESSGWEPIAGVEYEYFQFKETPQTVAEKSFTNLSPLTPGMHGYSLLRTQLNQEYFHDLFDESKKFGIEIEGHHTETGPGVYETALAYTSALRMADNATLFKFLAKSVGMKQGVIPSFMAKPWANLPGCSGHIHVSLRGKNGQNVFAVADKDKEKGREDAQYQDTRFMSQEGEWFLAGVLDGLTDACTNDKRVQATCGGRGTSMINLYFIPLALTPQNQSFWAPNAVTYGYDSRAASIRIISPPSVPPSATRLEIRVPGADMQPHFALASIFRLGLRGIEKKIQLSGPPISVLQRENKAPVRLAMSLEEGTKRLMAEKSIAREVLGDDFVDHYGGTRSHEVKLWNEAVTNWEVERYLELV
ncbi:glutamine synthetase/guanido kinase [Rhizoctonia solani AG-3 Rhs1AP]|uniref:Glutamine synthetase/guanido kinase n=1 Tax=Rhizoctonia solani AG-3 Rhs1AP TaxID=1086054 RepID=A0A0A1UKC2_9AGAM|nr:glutamine synthetase/guanido kinase [Rhizoctonia solani AG-3 Rhs1AP]